MTKKADYSTEEWRVLLQAPAYAATYVITSDMSVMGMLRETSALGKALKEPSAPAEAQELVDALAADLQEMTRAKEAVQAPEIREGEDAREVVRQGLQQAAALLDAKCSPAEATGFKQWLVDVARAVAQADKEGSRFGIGGVRVTDREEAALAEIASTLGLEGH